MIGPKRTTTETGGRIHQSRDFSSIRENLGEIATRDGISLIFRYLPPVRLAFSVLPSYFRPRCFLSIYLMSLNFWNLRLFAARAPIDRWICSHG